MPLLRRINGVGPLHINKLQVVVKFLLVEIYFGTELLVCVL